MKKIKPIKEWSLFAKCVLGYVIVFAVVIIGICVWEWNALAGYEADNRAAKADSDPDLYFEKYIEEFTLDKYKSIIADSLPDGEGFYSKETLVEYIAVGYDAGEITGKKNEEKWTESRPTYDIYAGEEQLLTLTLGVKAKDDFGYNEWKEGQISLDNQITYSNEVSIIVENDMVVTVNGVTVGEDYIQEACVSETVSARVAELTGADYGINIYNISNLLEDYELVVTDANGNELTYVEVDGIYDYTQMSDDNAEAQVVGRVEDIVDAYIKIVNKVINRTNMTKYFHKDGPMYEFFGSQQFKDSMYWNFAAKSVTFTEQQVTNIRQISEDIVICDIYFEADKTYDRTYNVNEDLLHEVISGEAILVKQDGSWYLDTLNLQ